MELWQAILMNAMRASEGKGVSEAEVQKLFESECYKVLERIKAILADDSMEDKECFEKIEGIVCLYEEIGSDGGGRHDFG